VSGYWEAKRRVWKVKWRVPPWKRWIIGINWGIVRENSQFQCLTKGLTILRRCKIGLVRLAILEEYYVERRV
jgi:hypothetical protein